MPETTITKQKISVTGLAPTLAAANEDGSRFTVDSLERVYLEVRNANGATRDVTIVKQRATAYVPGYGLVALADIVVTVPITTGWRKIGPISPAYVDADGFAHVTYSAHADVTVGVFELARNA